MSGTSVLLYLIYIFSFSVFLTAIQFFRNPKRKIILNENFIIAPADGKIVVIEKTFESEYFNETKIMISIFMSLWNVHVNRFPISGFIKYFKYHKGRYLVARNPKSSLENERTTVVIENSEKTEILFRQIAGIVARRIIFNNMQNEYVNQSDECGFIKFGSRVDIFLPTGTQIEVKLGQKVKGGLTPIARFKQV